MVGQPAPAGPSGSLEHSIAEIFTTFTVNSVAAIDVADVTIALRMLGIDIPRDLYRSEILPVFADSVVNGHVGQDTFKRIVLHIVANEALLKANTEVAFSLLDIDHQGVLGAKELAEIHSDLVEMGLEDDQFSLESIETMLHTAFATDHVTKDAYASFLQSSLHIT
ncbi:hypothetical protein DIPPA_05177 [Diplonema papillatum]|nr:hypothetical protein DIPPA_05177 [Diplonema papillatum]